MFKTLLIQDSMKSSHLITGVDSSSSSSSVRPMLTDLESLKYKRENDDDGFSH